MKNNSSIGAMLLVMSLGVFSTAAGAKESYVDLELEALMKADVQVTSAMKRSQPISNTASSIYVLTHQDLIDSGVQSIPQALGLVPGMQVRQIDNNQWAITSRFAGGRHSSNLLVLIDGQSFYNPTFAGVYWENIDVPLRDIDRIEVIRGQTGTLWGVNASNGVVNIITKNSIDTRSNYINASRGLAKSYDVNARHGGNIGEQGSYRIFAHSKNGNAASEGFFTPSDDIELNSIGLRADYALNDDLTFFTKWNYLHSNIGQTSRLVDPNTRENAFENEVTERDKIDFLFRVEERLSKQSNHIAQLSLNSESGKHIIFDEKFNAVDLDYQINTLLGEHQVDMGMYYRYNDIDVERSSHISHIGTNSKLENYGGFMQAQLNLIPDKFHIILGNMLAYNSYTDWENQPSLRAIYRLSPEQTLWFSVSEAVRVPSYLEHDLILTVSGSKLGEFVQTGISTIDNYTLSTYLKGSRNIEAEKNISYEVGYRYIESDFSLDLSVYNTQSDNSLSYTPVINQDNINAVRMALLSNNIPLALSILNSTPLNFELGSMLYKQVSGIDAVLTWNIAPGVHSEASYSVTKIDYDVPSGSIAPISRDSVLTQAMLKTNFKLRENQYLNINIKSETGDTYDTADIFSVDIGWRKKVNPNVSIAVNAWNLLSSDDFRYLNKDELHTSPTKVQKSFSASIHVGF